MSLTNAALTLALSATLTNELGTAAPAIPRQTLNILAGTADGQVDRVYAKYRTITNDATPDTIDLIGSLVDNEGNAVTFADICIICILNWNTTSYITLGAGSNPLVGYLGGTTPTKRIGKAVSATVPGIFLDVNLATGYPVTTGTADVLTLNTQTGGLAVNYSIFLLGRSV